MVDLYCERTAPGLWAEPINTSTNLAFLIAAWASWKLIQAPGLQKTRDGNDIKLLVLLIGSIWVGSSLFHMFATPWAMYLDTLPILLFQVFYLWLYFRKIVAMNKWLSAIILGGYLFAIFMGRQFPAALNGSLIYAPAFFMLIVLGIYHALFCQQKRFALLAASGVFLFSIFFRSIDSHVCDAIPFGTHFLWHLLNGVVLYLSMSGLIFNYASPKTPAFPHRSVI